MEQKEFDKLEVRISELDERMSFLKAELKNSKNDSKFDVKLFIIIILSFIIIVIIIILIIILGCRKSQLSIDSTVTPLYPNRQTDIDTPNEGY